MALIVQKFGGSSVADTARIRNVARIITETYRKGNNVVAVILPSATVRAAGLSTVARPEPPSRVTSQV